MDDWLSALIAGGTTLAGSYMTSQAAKEAAQAQQNAAATAADMATFTPYGVTTGYGTSWYDTANQTAGYELDPTLAAYRDQLFTMGAGALPTNMDPTANAQTYYNEVQSMLAPTRQAENLQMQQDLFGSGRLGLRLAGEGAGAGSGMVQPDVFGLNQSRSMADAALAQQSRQQSMNELDAAIARGTGLMQQGLGVEQLGMTPLTLGAEIGGRATTAGAAAGQMLMQGGLGAAQSNLAAGIGIGNTLADYGLGLMKYNA